METTTNTTYCVTCDEVTEYKPDELGFWECTECWCFIECTECGQGMDDEHATHEHKDWM